MCVALSKPLHETLMNFLLLLLGQDNAFLYSYIVDSAATGLNKEGDIALSVLVGATQRLLKRTESFMGWETSPLSISDEKTESLAPAQGETSLDFHKSTIANAPMCENPKYYSITHSESGQ